MGNFLIGSASEAAGGIADCLTDENQRKVIADVVQMRP